MKNILFIFFLLLLTANGCSDFEELNTNPNQPSEVSAGALFTAAIKTSVLTTSNEAFLLSNNIAQYTGKTLRIEVDEYLWNAFPTVWEGLYKSLTDIKKAIEIASAEENQQMMGATLILQVWIYSQLTNAYGDIPFSKTVDGSTGNFTPIYVSQELIYNTLFSDLDTAITNLNGSGAIAGDILYKGDASLWIKFANSLKMRLLMYASKKIEVATAFNAIVSSGSFFQSNDEQAALQFSASFPNQFPTIPLKTGDFDAAVLSKSMLQSLEKYKDPRLSRYARPDNLDFENPIFSGIQNSSRSDQQGSRLGLSYYDYPDHPTASQKGLNHAKGLLMTYAEVEFLIAEAIANEWIEGDIETHYKKGIEASHTYYQVNYSPFGWTNFEDFYAHSGVAYKNSLDLKEQKWLGLFFTSLDSYFEVRRWYINDGGWEGIPFMSPPIRSNSNDFKLPLRFLYPGQEQSLNYENYNEANTRFSATKLINGKMWILKD